MGSFHISWWSKVIYWKVRHLSSPLHVTMWDLRLSHQCFWGFRASEMWCSVIGWVVPFTLKDIMLSSEWVKQWFPMLWRHCFPSHHCELLSQKHSITPERSGCLLRYAYWFQWPHSLNTFAAIVDLSRFNNSCLKSPASTLVDLIFQSRMLRSKSATWPVIIGGKFIQQLQYI